MKILETIATVSVAALLISQVADAQDTTVDLATEVADSMEAFREKRNVPAVSVAIGRAGEIVYADAVGLSDLENAVQATEETVFRTASIAKSITAVAVLQLVDQGKISLDDPIQKHCPEFPETEFELTQSI